MAIPHFSAQIISSGRSVVDVAANRHGGRMFDEHLGQTFSYEIKPTLVHEEISMPEDVPVWLEDMFRERTPAQSSEVLWNHIQHNERVNGALARSIVVALPVELSQEQNIALMRDYVAHVVLPLGLVADWVYCDAPGNPHVHLMHTLRPVEEGGFGKKRVPVLGKNGNA